MVDIQTLKDASCQAIDSAAEELHQVSQEIWSHPELNFEEKYAHDVLTKFLDKKGFTVDKNYILDTAFRGKHHNQGKGPHVSVLCEYDALPGIGHACGHNLIAEVGVGAGIGIKAAMEKAIQTGKDIGQLTVLGTPAEEGPGGKIDLIRKNVFKSFDFCMMSHPFPLCTSTVDQFLAREQVVITYKGKASHAAGFPWDGVNALDAAVMAYNNISAMRQQMKPTWRVHGVITNGGAKPNIIPEESQMEFYVRAPKYAELEVLKAKVMKCFEAAAVATGCTVDIKWNPKPYYNVITNKTLATLFEANATNLGVEFCRDEAKISTASGSTDMGNVSHVVPSIHPMFYIGSDAVNHTRDFTTASGDPIAQPYTIKQAKALAMTAIDVMCNPELLQQVKDNFKVDIENSKA